MHPKKVTALRVLGISIMAFLIPSSAQTMTSIELVELINNHRANNGVTTELRHADFIAKVRKEIGDGILAERNISLGEYLDSNNQKRPMYQLDKEASIYMVSGEIGQVRMAIIRRWTELEAAVALPPSNDVQFDRASKLAKLCMDTLNLPQSGQLKLMADLGKQFGVPTQFLPSYGVDAPPGAVITAGSSEPTQSLTQLLAEYDMSTRTAYKLLMQKGVIEERVRPSASKGTKTFKAFTALGLRYGKNITSPNNPREVQPHFYIRKRTPILQMLGLEGGDTGSDWEDSYWY